MSLDATQGDPDFRDLPAGFGDAQGLPDPLPMNPLPTLRAWFDAGCEARATQNPSAITVATIDPDGTPSARIVLCRGIVVEPGYISFYTNYASRKSEALDANPRCAVVFHWDAFDRQARLECIAVRSPEEESDAYFATRSAAKRLAAWSSNQSKPIESRAALMDQAKEMARRFDVDGATIDQLPHSAIPRPPHWGGWRLWPSAVELWVGDPSRMHDRARWERELVREDDAGFKVGDWRVTRLQP